MKAKVREKLLTPIKYISVEGIEHFIPLISIDNFSSKPYDWYWNYNKEQQEEYFNKVFEELVLLNM